MEDARSGNRRLLRKFVSAWLEGEFQTVVEAFDSNIRWWTPLRDEDAVGPHETCVELRTVLAGIIGPVTVSALMVTEDGTRGVAELSAGNTSTFGNPTLVTSVVGFSASGLVAEGRTYLDLRAVTKREEVSS